MKENKDVYMALRNEINSMQEQQRNVWISMYSLFVALFVLGLQWSYYLFLVTYIVLIPFQCIINDYGWSVTKLSTYIRLFYEEETSGMHWETMHIYPAYQKYYSGKTKKLLGIMRYSGSAQLGFLSSAFFIGFIIKNAAVEYSVLLRIPDLMLILLSFILFFIIFQLAKDSNKSYAGELEEIITQYKAEVLKKDGSGKRAKA